MCVCVYHTNLTDDTCYNEHTKQVSQHLYYILECFNRISQMKVMYRTRRQYSPIETTEIARSRQDSIEMGIFNSNFFAIHEQPK